MFLLIIIILVVIGFKMLYYYLETNNIAITRVKETKYFFDGKLKSSLATKTELVFYNKLKEILNVDYNIFSKVRLADLIYTKQYSEFNKVKSKHFDFILTDNNLKPLIAIELDDKSHDNIKNKENDYKKNVIAESVGLKIIRVRVENMDDISNLLPKEFLK